MPLGNPPRIARQLALMQASDEAPEMSGDGPPARPWDRSVQSTRKELPMKVLVFVKATKDSEAGVMPSQELLAAMEA